MYTGQSLITSLVEATLNIDRSTCNMRCLFGFPLENVQTWRKGDDGMERNDKPNVTVRSNVEGESQSGN